MNYFEHELTERLELLREQGLFRQIRNLDSPQSPHIRIEGRTLLNFSSNDYLGLANEPALKAAAIEAIKKYGAGAGASRLVCGSQTPHGQLDEMIAEFKGAPAALSFSTGHAAALGTMSALMGKDDIIIIDKLVHASIIDGARLSGAKLRVFPHNDLDALDDILKWADSRCRKTHHGSHILIVTESVFSMDGDFAPLGELVDLKAKYGAWLMVDEAHATGLYGANRRGRAEELNVSDRIEIQMGTLGKSIGAAGGYICGSRPLIDYLINRARPLIFSTAPVPAAAAAAAAGIQFVQSAAGEERRQLLWQRIGEFHSLFDSEPGWLSYQPLRTPVAIIPLLIGPELAALQLSAVLMEQGIFIPAIRYPSVPRGQARLRLTFTAAHSPHDIQALCKALRASKPSTPVAQNLKYAEVGLK